LLLACARTWALWRIRDLIMLLEKAFYRDPVNGSTVFEAFSKRITHALDRNADADSDNYAAIS